MLVLYGLLGGLRFELHRLGRAGSLGCKIPVPVHVLDRFDDDCLLRIFSSKTKKNMMKSYERGEA